MQQALADMLLDSADAAAPLQRLPEPLFAGNEVRGTAVCLKGEDLKTAVVGLKVCAAFCPCSSAQTECILSTCALHPSCECEKRPQALNALT